MQNDLLSSKIVCEGITFDDVLLIPEHSDIVVRDVDLTTNLSRFALIFR